MDRLEELRARIPGFECLPDCGECCTCHCILSEQEKQRIEKKYSSVRPPDYYCGSLQYYEFCMFLNGRNECTIYEERPIRCRLFGCTDDKGNYRCFHGKHPAEPWTEKKLLEALEEYEGITKGQNEYGTFGLMDGQLKPITRGING